MSDYHKLFENCKSVTECLNIRDELMNSGEIAKIKKEISEVPVEIKKQLGQKLNTIRTNIQEACDNRIQTIQAEQEKDNFVDFDLTFWSDKYLAVNPGKLHPVTQTISEIVDIFSKMGFDIYDGPQVLDQHDNFTTVNTPDYHPARDMQDTFFLDVTNAKGENYVMRTQATSNWFQYATTHKPPFRVIFPSITFRNETMDATHDVNFHQFDMWLVDKNISVAHLFTLMDQFFKDFFGSNDIKIRQRPSYFPFVQPGFETDIYVPWFKGGQWVEVCGSGLINRDVLKMANIDPDEWQGIAWGFGIDRLTMLKKELNLVGQFYNGNLKFLKGR